MRALLIMMNHAHAFALSPTAGGRFLLLLAAGLSLLPSAALRAAEPIPDADCLQCHGDRDLTRADADGREVSVFVDAAVLAASRHATNSCWSCHSDIGPEHPDDGAKVQAVECAKCHREQSETFGASVHGVALARGDPGVPGCTDCHGSHQVLPRGAPNSPLNAANLGHTCGGCHEQQETEVRESVHGQALARGRREAPTCTDCHSEHRIEPIKGVSPIRISERICSQCHASERINAKYRMPADRVKTFLGSYHGLAGRLGSTRAANCASCHGVHFILPSSDPRSSIHPDHLVATCGQCHPGATESFAVHRVHVDLESGADFGSVVNRWVRRAYLILIALVVGSFTLHNGLLWWRQAVAARQASLAGEPRMDRNQRWQHALLALSFIALALSGFALQFPDSWAAWVLGSDETIRRWSHRIAAIVLALLGGYHLYYVLFTAPGRQLVRDLWFTRPDGRELAANARYLAGRGRPAQGSARFGYAEKIEYWSVFWGTVIMGVTGLILWFPVAATQVLPRWAVDVALTVHYYEAVLACLAIVVWHFYHVVFAPEVYPLNWAFWTGRRARPSTPPAAPPHDLSAPQGTDAKPGTT